MLKDRNAYLKVAIDEVKEKHSSHADEELRGSAETAQVQSKHSELLYRFDVRGHRLCGGGDRDGDVLSGVIVD